MKGQWVHGWAYHLGVWSWVASERTHLTSLMIYRFIHSPCQDLKIVPPHTGLTWFAHQIEFYNIFPWPFWREDLCSSISPPPLWCSVVCHTHGNAWHKGDLCWILCQTSVPSVSHEALARSHLCIGTSISYMSHNRWRCVTCMWCVVWCWRLWTFVWCWWWCRMCQTYMCCIFYLHIDGIQLENLGLQSSSCEQGIYVLTYPWECQIPFRIVHMCYCFCHKRCFLKL